MELKRGAFRIIVLSSLILGLLIFLFFNNLTGAAVADTKAANPLKPILNAGIVAIILLVIAMSAYTYVSLRKEPEVEKTEEEIQEQLEKEYTGPIDEPEDVSTFVKKKQSQKYYSELGMFIKTAATKGYTREQVEYACSAAGWPEADVKKECNKRFAKGA